MEKVLRILVLLILTLSAQGWAAMPSVTLVADEWPPFNGKPGSEREGYIVEVARAIFRERGFEVVYVLMPWTRALEMARTGKVDGVIGASKTDAPGFIFPNEELAANKLSFYVRKGHPWRYVGQASVENVTLGTIAGYDYRPWLLSYIEANRENTTKVQVLYGDDPLQRNLAKLQNGWIDAVVDNEAAIRSVSASMGILDQLECAGQGEETALIHIAFSPALARSQELSEILSRGIVEMRGDGRLREILAKYNLKDWK